MDVSSSHCCPRWRVAAVLRGIIFTWSGRAGWWASLFSDLLIQPLHCSRSVLLSRFSFNPRTVLHCDLENAGISSKPKCRWPLPAGAAQHHQPPAERCARVKQLRKHHTKCPVKWASEASEYWLSQKTSSWLQSRMFSGPKQALWVSAEGELLLQKSGTRAGGGQNHQLFPRCWKCGILGESPSFQKSELIQTFERLCGARAKKSVSRSQPAGTRRWPLVQGRLIIGFIGSWLNGIRERSILFWG